MSLYLGSESMQVTMTQMSPTTFPMAEMLINRYTLNIYSNNRVSYIGQFAFAYHQTLQQVYFPKCISINSDAFWKCTLLQKVSFPECTTIDTYAFADCHGLMTVDFPKCSYISDYAFTGCWNLISVNFSKCNYIGIYAFANCYNLLSLNLTGVSSVPTLSGSAVFKSTPIGGYSISAGQYGSVYVPSSLYNSFITATNWSLISSRIVSV